MKKILFALLLFGLNTNSFAQYIFEKGYYISNSGERMDGYIKNESWKNNPSNFEFRSEPEGNTVILGISQVSAFSVADEISFKRYTVKIDRASDEIKKMRTTKYPEFKEETIFLEVILTGKATLYSYSEGSLYRYFIETDTHPIEQLIYLRYIDPKTTNMGTNNTFQQQLRNIAPRPEVSTSKIQNLKYKRDDLLAYVLAYNGQSPKSYQTRAAIVQQKTATEIKEGRAAKDIFSVKIAAGIGPSRSTLNIPQTGFFRATETSLSGISYYGGVEFELYPVKRKSFSILFNPIYNSFKSDGTYVKNRLFYNDPQIQNASVSYNAFELGVGVRYAFFFGKDSRVFFNALLSAPLSVNSKIAFEGTEIESKEATAGFAFGAGYRYRKFSVEVRLHSKSSLLSSNSGVGECEMARTGLWLGYHLW